MDSQGAKSIPRFHTTKLPLKLMAHQSELSSYFESLTQIQKVADNKHVVNCKLLSNQISKTKPCYRKVADQSFKVAHHLVGSY